MEDHQYPTPQQDLITARKFILACGRTSRSKDQDEIQGRCPVAKYFDCKCTMGQSLENQCIYEIVHGNANLAGLSEYLLTPSLPTYYYPKHKRSTQEW